MLRLFLTLTLPEQYTRWHTCRDAVGRAPRASLARFGWWSSGQLAEERAVQPKASVTCTLAPPDSSSSISSICCVATAAMSSVPRMLLMRVGAEDSSALGHR